MTTPHLQSTEGSDKKTGNTVAHLCRRIGHVFLDVRQRRLHCLNEAARQLHREGLPFTPADITAGRLHTLTGTVVAVDDLPLVAAWRKQEPFESLFIWPRDQGGDWQVFWSAAPVLDQSGQFIGVVGTVSCGPRPPDLRSMAELAHDLRTPLQSLRLLCSLVERMPQADGELRQTMETVRAAADRAVQVALELLECSRGPKASSRRSVDAWFALEPFLTGLADEQAIAAQNKGLTLTADFSAVRGIEIFSDVVRLGRVLANLLVNAVRYTPLGRVDFRAEWRQETGGRVLALGVVDTGPGIAQEEQDSIFQPFERGRAGKEGDSGGSGLGLAVVDRLVEELHLSLEVYSEFGRGSAFHLLIPEKLLRAMPDCLPDETLPNP